MVKRYSDSEMERNYVGGRQRDQEYYDEPFRGGHRSDQEQESTGPYAGVGPKDYRRSDQEIWEDVNERLTQHGYIDPSDVQVEVGDGQVVLRGTVADRRTKRRVESVADTVTGVRDVHNKLRIQTRS